MKNRIPFKPTFWIVVILLFMPHATLASDSQHARDRNAINWRFSHFLPATHSLAKAFSDWATSLEKATGDKLNIDIYPASQLGSGSDQYDMVRTRVAHLAWIVPGYEQGRFPIFSLLETPFLVNDAVVGARSFHQWYADYADIEMKTVYPCLITASPPGRLSFKNKVVTHPDQMQGKRARVSTSTVGRYIRTTGGVTINLPVSDVRHALERGMIDALRFDFYSLKAMNLDHLLVNHLDMLVSSAPALVGINRNALANLPPNVRQTVLNYCSSEWSGKSVAAWQQLDYEALALFRENPAHSFLSPTAKEQKAWVDMTKPLLQEWKLLAKRKGLDDPQAALTKLRIILSENSASLNSPVLMNKPSEINKSLQNND